MRFLVSRSIIAAALPMFLASISAGAAPRVLIPVATQGSATWRYTTEKPSDNWTQPDFDDGKWSEGKAGFGVVDYVTMPAVIGTPWKTSGIWLRKTIDVPGPLEFASAALIVRHDENVVVYVGGTRVFSANGFNTEWTAFDVSRELRAALKPGKNVVAVHVTQTGGGQYIDLGLELDPERKLVVRPKPLDPAQLQRLRDARWPEEKARSWYAKVGPITGCNYLPRI